MNQDYLVDALGAIDEDMVQRVETLRNKKRPVVWQNWVAVAACFVLIMSTVLLVHNSGNRPPLISPTEPTAGQQTGLVASGVYVNHVYYSQNFLDYCLSECASKINVGEFIGYVSEDGITDTKIPAYRYNFYIEEIADTARIIVCYDDKYYVYSFTQHRPDGNEDWPANLLSNAKYLVISDSERELKIKDEQQISDILAILSSLGEKKSWNDVLAHDFEVFKDDFLPGAIWLDEEGKLCTGDSFIASKLTKLRNEGARHIIVVMNDNTQLVYVFYPARECITSDVFYILTSEQVDLLKELTNWIGF